MNKNIKYKAVKVQYEDCCLGCVFYCTDNGGCSCELDFELRTGLPACTLGYIYIEDKPKYSIESLDEYPYRFIVRFDDENYDYRRSVDIYTDNINKEEASEYIISKLSERFSNVKIEHCATQEQDKACEALVDEWLEEI